MNDLTSTQDNIDQYRAHEGPAKTGYGSHPWRIQEATFRPEAYALSATLFAQGNGLIGVRGSFEEGMAGAESEHGCYLNGVYFSEPIVYGESAYGFARNNERIASAPNPFMLQLHLDGEPVDFNQGTMVGFHRALDMTNGVLTRTLEWRSDKGKTLAIKSRRLVSMSRRELAVLEYSVTAVDFAGELTLTSTLDSLPPQLEASDDPRVGSGVNPADIQSVVSATSDDTQTVIAKTLSTGFYIGASARHRLGGSVAPHHTTHDHQPNHATNQWIWTVAAGDQVSVTKWTAFSVGRDQTLDDPQTELMPALKATQALTVDQLVEEQKAILAAFWETSDVTIDGNPSLQQGMRFNLFHLQQSIGRDGFNNIAAKGLTGHGYDGHYFWDTEVYVLPFFLYTQPELARNLLLYRHSILDAARRRARDLAIPRGCLFPWRTIGGEESSAYYPAGTAQYHINADIAWAVRQYHQVTGDTAFIRDYGAEIVLDSARMWLSIGFFNPRRGGQFCINGVTGPDEYTAVVNNNYFTNAMAQQHLRYAVELVHWLEQDNPTDWRRLCETLNLADDEPEQWQRAADHMFLPVDASTGLHEQDDSFLDKAPWDFANTPREHHPLLLHYHPLVIYRHQVSKQADMVLALLLLGDQFSLDEKRRDFNYYEAVTTHDSTLSACIHGILASELGYDDKAAAYFAEVARMDLDNHHGNTRHGVHTACMGGSWLGLVQGFGGMRMHGGTLKLAPRAAQGTAGYGFRICFQGTVLAVSVKAGEVHYRLPLGGNLTWIHDTETVSLSGQEVITRPLIGL